MKMYPSLFKVTVNIFNKQRLWCVNRKAKEVGQWYLN